MLPQTFDIIFRSVSLGVGAALLLSGSVAIASPRLPSVFSIAQIDSSDDDSVIVDTEPTEEPTTSGDSTRPTSESIARFDCQSVNGEYTVMYHPESQPGESFPWATPTGLGGGWSAERRCNEISRRLEAYRPDGLLELRTAVENSYNTVCITTEKNPDCRIVLTVPPGQNPRLTRDRVFRNLTVADSGEQTQAVNTFVGGGRGTNEIDQLFNIGRAVFGGKRSAASDSIDLRPFLDRADGGTGTQLRGGVPTRSNPRLNPRNFRN